MSQASWRRPAGHRAPAWLACTVAVAVTAATYATGLALGSSTSEDPHTPTAAEVTTGAADSTDRRTPDQDSAGSGNADEEAADGQGADRGADEQQGADRGADRGADEQQAADGAPAPLTRPEPPAGDDPDDLTATLDEAARHQPVTGPGRPPLSAMDGGGPHDTHRTTGQQYAALTFDDGPDPRWTPHVLELLRQHEVEATFCVVGQLARRHPDLIREIVRDGHTLCNHSWDHDIGLGGRSRAEIRDDLQRTNEAIHAATPESRISYYRQPGGAWTERVVTVAAELGMSSLHWEIDPADWREPGADPIARQVRRTADGGIVLLHDGGGDRSDTVEALREVLPELAGRLALDALPAGTAAPPRHGLGLPVKPAQL